MHGRATRVAQSSVIGIATAALFVAARPAVAQRADEIVARNLAARGGLARIRAIRTEQLMGRASLGPGADGSDTVELARPGRVRTTIHVGSGVFIQGYDGHTAWAINGLRGDSTAHMLGPDAARNVAAGADMDGPLVDASAKGNRIALAGVDTADGRPAYALVVRTASGLTDTYYIDTVSFLQTKWVGQRVAGGARVVYESFFRDYRRVDGVMFAFRIDSDTRGRPGGQHLVFDRIVVNLPLDSARFSMPHGSLESSHR